MGGLWTGQTVDYLSGGTSYGFLKPLPATSSSMPFLFIQQGDDPLYDVMVDAVDVTKWQKLSRERGLVSDGTSSEHELQVDKWNELWNARRETRTTLTIGNVGPGGNRLAWEAPIPEVDDQRYEFTIWARNGLFTEQVLMHRASSGWVWAWRLERTPIEVKDGKPQKLDEQIMPDFPTDKLT